MWTFRLFWGLCRSLSKITACITLCKLFGLFVYSRCCESIVVLLIRPFVEWTIFMSTFWTSYVRCVDWRFIGAPYRLFDYLQCKLNARVSWFIKKILSNRSLSNRILSNHSHSIHSHSINIHSHSINAYRQPSLYMTILNLWKSTASNVTVRYALCSLI